MPGVRTARRRSDDGYPANHDHVVKNFLKGQREDSLVSLRAACRSHSRALIELLYTNRQPTNIFDAVRNKKEVSAPLIERGALYPFMLFLSRVA